MNERVAGVEGYCRSPVTVVLLGDSITQGLGSKQINYSERLRELLDDEFEVVNLAMTGTTIDYALSLAESEAFPECSYCVIAYGNVDAQIRPSRAGRIFPRLPERFRKNGMLMPRPFYSANPKKKTAQYFENMLRRVFSEAIRKVDGEEQWVSLDSFSLQYGRLIELLGSRGIRCICASTVYIDEHLFRGTTAEYMQFNNAIEESARRNRAAYIDFFESLKKEVDSRGWDSVYNRDHFHPNKGGYELMAESIAAVLKNIHNEARAKQGATWVNC